MAILLGMKPSEINIGRGKLPSSLPVVPIISESDLLLNRPDLKQSERMTASANSRVDMFKTARLPRLNLLGSAGLISRGANQMLSANSGTYLVGAGISLPVFEGFRNKSNIARELYVKGLTSFLEAIDAERTALKLERQAVNLKGQQLIYTIALIKAMGGYR